MTNNTNTDDQRICLTTILIERIEAVNAISNMGDADALNSICKAIDTLIKVDASVTFDECE